MARSASGRSPQSRTSFWREGLVELFSPLPHVRARAAAAAVCLALRTVSSIVCATARLPTLPILAARWRRRSLVTASKSFARHHRGDDEGCVFASILDLRFHVVGIVVRRVLAAAVGEAVYDERVVGISEQLSLAAPVASALEWIGQGLALEPHRVGQYLGDGHLVDVVVEVQQIPRPEHALRAGRDDGARLL